MKRAILLGIFSVLVLMSIVSMVQANEEKVEPVAGGYIPDPTYVPYLTNSYSINGAIAAGEYTGAAYNTEAPGTAEYWLYAFYNDDHLIIGLDVKDYTDHASDGTELFIDVNNNNVNDAWGDETFPLSFLAPESPTAGSDCGISIKQDDTKVEKNVCVGHTSANTGFGTTNKSGTAHRVIEFAIELSVLPAVNTQFGVGIWYGDYTDALSPSNPMSADSCTAGKQIFYVADANSDKGDCFEWTSHVTNSSLHHWILNKPYAPNPSPETEIYLSPGEYEVLKTTDADMTFDGRIGHDEYYSSSYIAFQVPARCGLAQANVYIYSVYSDNYVYFGVDAVYDTTNNASYVGHVEDSLRVYVDSDYDGVLDFHPHSLAPKGNSPSIAYADSEWYMNTTDLTEYGAAIGLADSYSNARFDDSNKSATNHRMWELKASRLAFPDVGESFGVGVWGIANYCNWGGGYIINHTDYAPYQYPLTMLNDSGNWTNETEDNLNVSALANWTLVEEGVLPPGEHQGQDLTPPPEEQPLIAPQYYSTPMVVAYGTLAVAGVASYIVLFKAFALSAAQFSAGVATAGLAWLVLVLGVATGYFHL